tara:strand:- start:10268 stop:10675 length:408 start_codon:yes stop_codon:yes gene_type:complete
MSVKYSDYDIDFSSNAFTGDISLKKEAAAIRQSVQNIIMTKKGEKPFNRGFGVGIRDYLFENISSSELDIAVLRSEIQTQLINFEPRVVLDEIIIDDSLIDRNELGIQITYKILKESDISSSPSDRLSISITKVR